MKAGRDMSVRGKDSSTHTFDLVVCGGGLAGVCAALAAARLGLDTALVQDRPVLGGNSSSEIRVPLAGASNGNPWAREGGIIEELTLTERYNNFTSRRESMVNDVWDLVLYDKCRQEENLSLFLNTSIRRVEMAGRQLRGVLASQLGSEKELTLRGDFFVDATGDAVVSALAGADFMMGREARGEFHERWAAKKADGKIMGSSLLFAVRDVGYPVPFRPPSWSEVYPADSPTLVLRFHNRLPGHWWIEIGWPYDIIDDNEKIYDELMRHVMGVWDHLKNQADHGFSNYALDWIAKVPGKRESRRVIGDCILTGNDVFDGRIFSDAVAHGGWYFDMHVPGGILAGDEPPEPSYGDESLVDLLSVPLYSIPFRSLYARDVDNLFLAGRDFSATHVAFGSARLMATCAAMGQAVGTGAKVCRKHGILPRQVVPEHIRELQQQLLKDDQYVPGARNEDNRDLARGARVTASSSSPLRFPEPEVPKRLDIGRGELFPVSTDTVETISLMMESDRDTEVTLRLRRAARTCDFTNEEDIAVATPAVRAGGKQWVDFSVSTHVEPESLVWIALDPNDSVSIYGGGRFVPTGTVPLHKPHGRWLYQKRDPDEWVDSQTLRRVTGWCPSLRIVPQQSPYTPKEVLSGVTRSDDWTHLWVSDASEAFPQWVALSFASPVSFTTAQLTFDTHLNLVATFDLPVWKAPAETVRDYQLSYEKDGQWRTLATVTDNFLRHRVHRFEPIATNKFRVDVLSTWGCPSARLFEIRLYDD